MIERIESFWRWAMTTRKSKLSDKKLLDESFDCFERLRAQPKEKRKTHPYNLELIIRRFIRCRDDYNVSRLDLLATLEDLETDDD